MSRNSLKTVSELLELGKKRLEAAGIPTPLLDCQLLMMFTMGWTKVQLLTRLEERPPEEKVAWYLSLLGKRAAHMPVQYILNHCEFMGLDFYVDAHVLIPRPDTEILVELALDWLPEARDNTVLEIGTGSGCIAISLARYLKRCRMVGIDISDQALEIARRNAKTHQVDNKIAFFNSNIFNSIPPALHECFDGIVSNPPYIPRGEIEGLETNVKDYEPVLALDGGVDGLDFYRALFDGGRYYLKKGGCLMVEIGEGQYQDIHEILAHSSFEVMEARKDLSGRLRTICARRI